MVTWRAPELEAIFGGPLDDSYLTEAVLQSLVEAGTRETDQLEFKGVPPGKVPYPKDGAPSSQLTSEQEFAKDVGALANHRGGVLILGIDEKLGVATSLTPISSSTAEAEGRRLDAALVNFLVPYAPRTFVPVLGATGWYLLVVVPPSRRAPHCVTGKSGDPSLRYPVRSGTTTRWLDEHEVAERYVRRLELRAEGMARIDHVVEVGRQPLPGDPSAVWLYVASVPEVPTTEEDFTNSTVELIDNWHHAAVRASPLGEHLDALGRGIPAPGRVTFGKARSNISDDDTTPGDGYAELHLDGSAFLAARVGGELDSDADALSLSDNVVANALIYLTDEALEWTARTVGAWGSCTLVAGMLDPTIRATGATTKVELGAHRSGGRARRLDDTRVVRLPIRTQCIIDLSATRSTQDRLAATSRLLNKLSQEFGRAEMRQISRDGTLDARQWEAGYESVRVWARNRGVPAILMKGHS
jgi:hypothetical protein